MKTKHSRRAERHRRISRKIEVNLKPKGKRHHPRIDSSKSLNRGAESAINERRQPISQDNFLNELLQT
jgi:hypothetical protein